jgi:3-phenylpropionate/trans-cinnamate dioxygenase ferredoxin reductase component
MSDQKTLLIIGASLAGAKAAEGARSSGYEGRIVLVGSESHLPYERPPLSKDVLRGEKSPDTAQVNDADYYRDNAIELISGVTVDSLDVEKRRAQLSNGDAIGYDSVILATGSEPRRLDVPGAQLGGMHYLRTVDDSLALSAAIKSATRVAVIGAGWIGSEVAASAKQMGADVVLIEPEEVPLHRVLGSQIGGMFAKLHADNGVALRLGVGAAELRGSASVEQVVLSDGSVESADLVVVGIGVVPRTELATAAGLKVDNGIKVDEKLRASVGGVFAAGDVANAWHPHYERHLRVEHWANAQNQGSAAGANAVSDGEAYTRLPYFFSDQYDLGLEYVGYASAEDEVTIRGDFEGREFIAFYHRGGVVTAAMNVNVWDVVDDLRAIITGGRAIDSSRLADPDVPLGELA